MKILVVSGFLGAGKTTFIKELIQRTGKFLVILENEYGENDLDSRSLKQGGGEIEILEFMEGCVCCSKKDSFINTIISISSALNPEFLIIEPTGLGKLSNILNNIKKIEYENISLLKPLLILSPQNINNYLNNFKEIYLDQILNAEQIIFSKIEQEDNNFLEQAKQQILKLKPNAEIITNSYSKQNQEWWDSLLDLTSENKNLSENKKEENDLDLEQISLKNAKLDNPSQLIILLEDILRGELGQIVRAKGVLKVGREFLRFDVADNLYGIIYEEEENPKTQCFFVGKNIKIEKLLTRLNSQLSSHNH